MRLKRSWKGCRLLNTLDARFLVRISRPCEPFHPFLIGGLLPDLSGRYKTLTCSSAATAAHSIGEMHIQIASETHCRRRMRGAPQKGLASAVFYPFLRKVLIQIASTMTYSSRMRGASYKLLFRVKLVGLLLKVAVRKLANFKIF